MSGNAKSPGNQIVSAITENSRFNFVYPIILRQLMSFYSKHRELPSLKEIKETLLPEIKKLVGPQLSPASKFLEGNLGYIISLLGYMDTQTSPLCSIIGSVISQEVIKKTGKFTPLRQMYFDQYYERFRIELRGGKGEGRHGDQVRIFGEEFQEKLGSLKIFMVGAGALGCEFLKQAALMGISTKE